VFAGGCFFVNLLVELSGQSDTMGRQLLKGFVGFSELFQIWLREAASGGQLKADYKKCQPVVFDEAAAETCGSGFRAGLQRRKGPASRVKRCSKRPSVAR
jgi:hypothetical protein